MMFYVLRAFLLSFCRSEPHFKDFFGIFVNINFYIAGIHFQSHFTSFLQIQPTFLFFGNSNHLLSLGGNSAQLLVDLLQYDLRFVLDGVFFSFTTNCKGGGLLHSKVFVSMQIADLRYTNFKPTCLFIRSWSNC